MILEIRPLQLEIYNSNISLGYDYDIANIKNRIKTLDPI